jgi:hypothetical protein
VLRIVSLVRGGHLRKTGLPARHPFIRFAKDPESLNNALALDDSVFWGALQMMTEAHDPQIHECAQCLRDRRFPKSIDIRHKLLAAVGLDKGVTSIERDERKRRLDRLIASIEKRLQMWAAKKSQGIPRILTDRAARDPYKRLQESKGPLNQIHIRLPDNLIHDVAECSPVIAAIETFELFRAYVDGNDTDAKDAVDKIIKEELGRN